MLEIMVPSKFILDFAVSSSKECFLIEEFCAATKISLSTFYEVKNTLEDSVLICSHNNSAANWNDGVRGPSTGCCICDSRLSSMFMFLW